jgi:hypothetical protein
VYNACKLVLAKQPIHLSLSSEIWQLFSSVFLSTTNQPSNTVEADGHRQLARESLAERDRPLRHCSRSRAGGRACSDGVRRPAGRVAERRELDLHELDRARARARAGPSGKKSSLGFFMPYIYMHVGCTRFLMGFIEYIYLFVAKKKEYIYIYL